MDDLAATFEKYEINLDELDEYLKWVDTPEFALKKHNPPCCVVQKRGEESGSSLDTASSSRALS